MQQKINNTVICLWMRKNLTAKTLTGWFSGHHSRNSTIITTSSYKQGIPSTLTTYSWTFTPIPTWTCSLVMVPLSDAWLPSTWLTVARIPVRDFKTPIWKDCWLQSSSDGCADPSTQLQNTNLKRLLTAKFFSSSTQWRSRRCLVTKPYSANTHQLL